MLYGKGTAGQQVLCLKAIEVAQRKRMYQTFLTTVGMCHIVEKLNVIDLVERVLGHNSMAAPHPSPIRSGKLRFVTKFLPEIVMHKCCKRRIEDIQNQPAVFA